MGLQQTLQQTVGIREEADHVATDVDSGRPEEKDPCSEQKILRIEMLRRDRWKLREEKERVRDLRTSVLTESLKFEGHY